jgi:hypothetical protein
MANQTLLDDYTALASTHWLYERNRDRWQFLMESYTGGEEYRRAGHLTRYNLETQGEYSARLANTPLDNHCQNVISTYVSFMFREEPEREFGTWEGQADVEDFLKDCDMEGRSLDAFMKQTSIWSSVFGMSWIIMTKPNLGAASLGQELEMGVRPYVNLLTPLIVSDWKWERMPGGRYELSYFKYVEEVVSSISTVREWTRETIKTWIVDDVQKTATMEVEEINQLGKIPAILVYNIRGITKDIGISDITDIADLQRSIYNLQSENEQSIRLDGHPSLVVPPTAQLGSGAGAIIQLQENSDPGLNPYYLEHGGNGVSSIHSSIDKLVEAIDRIAFTGGVRATGTRTMSGIAMETEFQLLNAKLAEKADNLELAEEQMWILFGLYQNRVWEGEVEYPSSFNIRDDQREFQQLTSAKSAATDPVVLRIIDEQIVELLGEEKERLPFIDPNPQVGRLYPDGEIINSNLPAAYQPASNPDVPQGQNCGNCEYYKPGEMYCTKFDAPVRAVFWCAKWEPYEEEESASVPNAEVMKQIQDMIMTGMTNAEIMAALPGVTVEDIVYAAAEAARNNN